jgi:hypothetical protein
MPYYVKKKETCFLCNGSKYISNPIYEDFAIAEKKYVADNPQPTSDCEYQAWNKKKYQWECDWFANQGYPGGASGWPIEEYLCDNCDGTGIVQSEVDLMHALKDIGVIDKIDSLKYNWLREF